MGFSAGSPRLINSDKTRYPLFFQVNSPEDTLYKAVVSLLHRFQWRQIAVVKQDEDLFNDVSVKDKFKFSCSHFSPKGKLR